MINVGRKEEAITRPYTQSSVLCGDHMLHIYFFVLFVLQFLEENQFYDLFPFSAFPEMPCLAEYADGLWYRAKIVSIKEFNPLSVLVLFVDYGSTEKLTINR